VTKEEILREIRRTADDNGGVPLGKQRFFAETGIRESDWAGRWWTRWSDAVREAGCEPQAMNKPLPEAVILEAAVLMVRKLGHFPTGYEIRLACASDATLPSHNTFRRFGGLGGLREKLVGYCRERGASDVLALLSPDGAAPPAEQILSEEPISELADGFVYLLKSGRHYKIGKALSVDQRKRQLDIQLPERAEIVHRIKTDDPLGIEAYWHRRFATKRLNGEWFSLTAVDVKAFRRRRFM
jgi:hypothetical protein